MTEDRFPDFAHLSEVVRRWREVHGISQREIASRRGPSDNTLSKIENGLWRASKPNQTLAALDRGFGWAPGTARDVLYEGHDPANVVGGAIHDLPGYVRGPGEKVEGGASDDAVLRAIQQMQEDLRAMSERLARLEGDGS